MGRILIDACDSRLKCDGKSGLSPTFPETEMPAENPIHIAMQLKAEPREAKPLKDAG